MTITLNNRIEEFEADNMTIIEIMKVKKFTFPNLIIKLNHRLIRKPEYQKVEVNDGDILEIIHLISGG